MTGVQTLLLDTLDNMLEDDLRRFKFLLTYDLPEGLKAIGQGRLENKKTVDIVQLMVGTYGEEDAVKVTLHALRKANQNNLAQILEKKHGGTATAQAVPPCPAGQGRNGASSNSDRGKVQATGWSNVTIHGGVHFK